MFYRLFKSFEIYVLIAILILAGVYSAYDSISSIDYVSVKTFGYSVSYDFGDGEVTFTPDNIDQYSFKNLGVDAIDVYRKDTEPMPEDIYQKIEDAHDMPVDEADDLMRSVLKLDHIPLILILLFIPIFFGRMFSDGTLKNIIASGCGRGTIYLTSLIFSGVLGIAMYLTDIAIFFVMSFCLGWHPPFCAQVILPLMLVDVMLILTVSSISILVLFASQKKVASIVAGFLLAALLFLPVNGLIPMVVFQDDMMYISNSSDLVEFTEAVKEKGSHTVGRKINDREYYILYAKEDPIPPLARYTCLTLIYMDPYLVNNCETYYGFENYPVVRDGIAALNIANCVFWTLATSAAGILVFRKREIHC